RLLTRGQRLRGLTFCAHAFVHLRAAKQGFALALPDIGQFLELLQRPRLLPLPGLPELFLLRLQAGFLILFPLSALLFLAFAALLFQLPVLFHLYLPGYLRDLDNLNLSYRMWAG